MSHVSKNFTAEELSCPCCGVYGVTASALDKLQRVRDILGKPLYINSAFRCKKYNEEIGGAPKSQHLLGNAFDVRLQGIGRPVLLAAAKLAGFTGIGLYNTFVHLDIGPARSWDLRKGD